MARLANAKTDYRIDVDGIGTFIFGKRSMADQMMIGAEFARMTGGVEQVTPWLGVYGGAIAALTVLTVEAPEGWDPMAMDPLDEETYSKLLRVHSALQAKEESFRQKPVAKEPGGGTQSLSDA